MKFTPDIFDFSSEATFLRLQNNFLKTAYSYGYGEFPESFEKIQFEDFDINYRVTKRGQESYVNIFFYEDFLKNEIPKLSENQISKIEKKLKSSYEFKRGQRKRYLEDYLDRLIKLDHAIYSVVFLCSDSKIEILWEIRKIIEFIKGDKVWINKNDESKKLKLYLSRAEVIGLIFLLYQKGITQSESFSELGRLIDDNFICYDEATRSYKEITSAKTTLSGYKNHNKSLNTVITTLKKLLSDEEFYNPKK